MTRHTIQTALLIATLVSLVVVLSLGLKISSGMDDLSTELPVPPTEVATMQSKTTKWTDAHGVEWSVTTQRSSGESLEDWCKRHDDAVAATQRDHPPV